MAAHFLTYSKIHGPRGFLKQVTSNVSAVRAIACSPSNGLTFVATGRTKMTPNGCSQMYRVIRIGYYAKTKSKQPRTVFVHANR